MSEQTRHTPGPWSIPHFAEPDVNCECGFVLTDHMMGAVATVHCSGEGGDWKSHGDNPKFAEACANARLIAAAPDMLAALKSQRITINVLFTMLIERDPEFKPTKSQVWAAVIEGYAAIAKAEGRAP